MTKSMPDTQVVGIRSTKKGKCFVLSISGLDPSIVNNVVIDNCKGREFICEYPFFGPEVSNGLWEV